MIGDLKGVNEKKRTKKVLNFSKKVVDGLSLGAYSMGASKIKARRKIKYNIVLIP